MLMPTCPSAHARVGACQSCGVCACACICACTRAHLRVLTCSATRRRGRPFYHKWRRHWPQPVTYDPRRRAVARGTCRATRHYRGGAPPLRPGPQAPRAGHADRSLSLTAWQTVAGQGQKQWQWPFSTRRCCATPPPQQPQPHARSPPLQPRRLRQHEHHWGHDGHRHHCRQWWPPCRQQHQRHGEAARSSQSPHRGTAAGHHRNRHIRSGSSAAAAATAAASTNDIHRELSVVGSRW